jgi:hypothetical protein
MVDAAQRAALFVDVVRQRGNAFREHRKQVAPHVLDYAADVIVDGRKLDRPVNYVLTRIIPPPGIEVDDARRPFVVVDPRAGHGPGIGGFKADSEIGVALKAGHPCYFVGFLPDPMPGQTLGDIARAEAVFLEAVIAAHPEAGAKPCVIGNCQAGWAVMILAAVRPELFGPIIIAGSPLSYWAGVHGKNPMRYTGGLVGGSWLTAFASDLGCGKFDGALLVQNFENQNPANTLWAKQYKLYSEIDTEAPRYLGFEKWWGSHVNLSGDEIQSIVDELFVGNKLAAGLMQTLDGHSIDLRSIRSPIVVFCSEGDNITPPQQALGWILDLYDNVDEIRSYRQTIVYSVHETVGHLGIFVSGGVARKEHDEFSSNIDLIDTLPPGLYEAIFTRNSGDIANADLVSGEWLMRCEARTLDDIRALGGNNLADERCFATAARVSETNLALYRTFVQPFVRAMVNPISAEWLRQFHPLRLQYELFSDANPLMAANSVLAAQAGKNRQPAAAGNPFLAMQEAMSQHIVTTLDAWRKTTETLAEKTFYAVYGNPLLQSAAGIDAEAARGLRKAAKNPLHKDLMQLKLAELRSRVATGGLRECLIRAALYVGLASNSVDERGFETIRRIRMTEHDHPHATLSEFKDTVRTQYFILLIDERAALAAIPRMLPPNMEQRRRAATLLRQVISARGDVGGEVANRLERMTRLFEREEPGDRTTAAA